MISISLFQNAETKDFAPGEKIFSAGEEGKLMYFVAEGEVDILVGSIVTEIVKPGGIFRRNGADRSTSEERRRGGADPVQTGACGSATISIPGERDAVFRGSSNVDHGGPFEARE
jgi:hypothetical protein